MSNLKNALPNRRATTFMVVVISLLAFFLLPYLFFYVPNNEAILHQQAFLKLNQATKNIINKDNDSRNYFRNTKTPGETIPRIKLSDIGCNYNTKVNFPEDSVCFKFYNSDGWHIIYEDSISRDSSFYYEHDLPVSDFVGPCVASSKELFQSLILVHYCNKNGKDTAGTIIYQDSLAGMEKRIVIDSFIPHARGLRSSDIIDIELQGIDFKMFTYPFEISQHRLILCGLLKKSDYNGRLHSMPVSLQYSIFICILFFILSLPFLKIFMMNEQDRLSKSGLLNVSRFLFAMATFVTLVVVQLFLLWKGNLQVQSNLKDLSVNIESALTAELNQANNQMILFDNVLRDYIKCESDRDSAKKVTDNSNKKYHTLKTLLDSLAKRKNCDDKAIKDSLAEIEGTLKHFSDSLYKKFALLNITIDVGYNPPSKIELNNKLLISGPSSYNYFDHTSWITNAGKESIRGQFFNIDSFATSAGKKPRLNFVDVRERNYYKMLKNISRADSPIMIAPVYSWANNAFRVNICRKANVPDMFIQVLQTRLYSLVNTVLPPGYGYCLISDNGQTLVHSDTLKSLRENFRDETNQVRWIREAINSRQTNASSNVPFYGKKNAMRIQPLKQHPLFLVVFYDNSFQEPINIRILAFAILLSLVTYGLLFILGLFLYPRPHRSFLFSPIDYFNWLTPQKNLNDRYFNGSLLILFYILILTISCLFIPDNLDDFDYAVLTVAVLTPFNLLFALRLLRKSARPNTVSESVKNIAIPFATSLIVFLIGCFYHPLNLLTFGVLEGLVILFMIGIAWKNGTYWYSISDNLKYRLKKITEWETKTETRKKNLGFSTFVTLFIIAMAVLPTAIFSWFAYHHELIQSVKKEQLHLAKNLQRRERTVKSFLKVYQPNFKGDDSLFEAIQYGKGIYPIYSDTITHGKDSLARKGDSCRHLSESEPFYLGIANNIGFNYEDPSYLPALQDSSEEDNLWHWDIDSGFSNFDYSKPKWLIPPGYGRTKDPKIDINIKSKIPADFYFASPVTLMAILLMILLLYGLYRLVQSVTRRLFLTKIVVETNDNDAQDPGIWKECFAELKPTSPVKSMFVDGYAIKSLLEKEYDEFKIFISPDIAKKEMEYTKRTEQLRPLFDCVWGKCSDQEKFLLYSLAADGLINHKNEALIYKMLRNKIVIINNERIKLISYSFRQYIVAKKGTEEEKELQMKVQSGGSWTSMRTIFIVIILSVLVFLFLTQQEVSGKIIALVTSLTTIVPLLLKFASGSSAGAEKK